MEKRMVKTEDEVRNSFKNAIQFITWDWSSLLFFELIYKFLLLIFLLPLEEALMARGLNEAGIGFVTEQAVLRLLQSPMSLLFIVPWILLLLFAVCVEICAVFVYFESARMGRRTGPLILLGQGARRALSLLRPKKAGIIPLLLMLLPLTGFMSFFGPLRSMRMIESLQDFSRQQPAPFAAFTLLSLALCLFVFYRIFSVPEVVLEDGSFRDACRRSRLMMKGRTGRTLLSMLGWGVIYTVVAACVSAGIVLALFLWARIFYAGNEAGYAFWFALSRLRNVISMLASIFFMICNLGMLTTLYYQYHGGKPACVGPLFAERIRDRTPRAQGGENRWWGGKPRKQSKRPSTQVLSPTLRIGLLFLLLLLYTEVAVIGTHDWFSLQQMQIIAHRGGAAAAPENTLAAIREAGASGAEYAEIDVRQTKDGELIALHDSTPTFSKEFSGGKVPALEEALRTARGRTRLMIELKGSGAETAEMAEKTVDLIHQYDMERQCVIAAMDYSVLERVKSLDTRIQTAYVMAAVYGDFSDFSAADIYSIEETFLTSRIIDSVHGLNKPVYAWTVNGEKSMRRMVLMGVDGIVTDNPRLAGYVRETQGMDRFPNELAQRL